MKINQPTPNMNATMVKYDNSNDGYDELLTSIRERFNMSINGNKPLFKTSSGKLFRIFLANLSNESRQHYNCDACKEFVNRYAGLVTISEAGEIDPPSLGGDVPPFFATAMEAMREAVLKSQVIGQFLSSDKNLGRPVTGEWNHMYVQLHREMLYSSKEFTADQAMKDILEEFNLLKNSLLEYPLSVIKQAVTLLKTNSLPNAHKFIDTANWLRDLQDKINNTLNQKTRDNLIWLAVATAPTGFCHFKNNMMGTLLDDIKDGLSFESIKRKFAPKVDATKLRRPTAAPSDGNIAEAERLVDLYGVRKSFERRFATKEELKTEWTPVVKPETVNVTGGMFDHLKQHHEAHKIQTMSIPPVRMSWRTFKETVMTNAETIEYMIKSSPDHYGAILTAVHPDAPPIIQWDLPEQRNPFNCYVYPEGSYYTRWGIPTGWCKVTAICLTPSMWYGNFSHHGRAAHLILEGAKDNREQVKGNALFPSVIKSEFKKIDKVIEAYSNSADVFGQEEASACGIVLQDGIQWNASIRVTSEGESIVYLLDRWE
jgi:hypothetical protein